MTTRNQILSAGMLRPPHPVYGVLSYGRWQLFNESSEAIGEVSGHELRAIQWVIATRDHTDPAISTALASENPREAFRKLWEPSLHVSDVPEFVEWWNGEMLGHESAATTHKPDTRLGKSEASEEPTPTT